MYRICTLKHPFSIMKAYSFHSISFSSNPFATLRLITNLAINPLKNTSTVTTHPAISSAR